MFTDKNKGKIIISVERDNLQLNSFMQCSGIAQGKEVVISTLLINFVSFVLKNDKDPREIIEKNLEGIIDKVKAAKQL